MRHPTLQVGRHLGAALAIGAIAAPLVAAQSPDSVERNRDAAQQRALDRDRPLDRVTPDARDAVDGRLPDAVPAPRDRPGDAARDQPA